MKKITILFLSLFIAVVALNSNTTKIIDSITGSWAFTVSQAPWEFSRGVVSIQQQEEKDLSGKIIFRNGYELEIEKIEREDEKKSISFEVTIDGYSVRTIATVKNDTLSGYVHTYDGNMPFSATRYVPEN